MKEQRPTRKLSFGDHVMLTRAFVRSWERLTHQQRQQIEPKIRLLAINPRHPSLHAHRHQKTGGDIWIGHVNHSYRVLYTQQGTTLSLLEVGPHRIVDRAHHRHVVP